MDDEELLTWTLRAPLGITLTPNQVLQGFREGFRDEVNPVAPINQQIFRWNIALNMFHALWEQEYTRQRFTLTWKNQGNLPQIRDIVLFKNELIYKNPISAARVEQLLRRKNGDVYGTTISCRHEVGGRKIVGGRQAPQSTVSIHEPGNPEPSGNCPHPHLRLNRSEEFSPSSKFQTRAHTR